MLGRLGRSAEDRNRALDATRRFAADAGHELRTPLTSVQATLSAIARHPDMPAAQRGDARPRRARRAAAARRAARQPAGARPRRRGAARARRRRPRRGRRRERRRGRRAPPGHDADRGRAGRGGRLPRLGAGPADPRRQPRRERGPPRPGRRPRAGHAAPGGERARAVDRRRGRRPGDPRGRARARVRAVPPGRRRGAADRTGSGLGLALVAQQARLHDAEITVGDSPLGGALMRVDFPLSFRRSRSPWSSGPGRGAPG